MGSGLTAYILARRAGMKADFPREYADWAKRPMLFMPSPLTSTAIVSWRTCIRTSGRKPKVCRKRRLLYASFASDGAVPEMASLFGARLVETVRGSEVTLKFVVPFGDFKLGRHSPLHRPTASR